MKTLLISTDFSAHATHAAEYGYKLAKQIKANVLLWNAVIVPAEMPQAGLVIWPLEEHDMLMDESTNELKRLKAHLEHTDHTKDFQPTISYKNHSGILTEVINNILISEHIDLVIMGTHGAGGLSTFFMGNHSRSMIDTITKPTILVPSEESNTPVKKIAFATDFKEPEDDLASIYALIPLATQLNAEILITHIYNENDHSPEFHHWIHRILLELSSNDGNQQISYKVIKHQPTEDGLDWICKHGQIDMLAMVHRPHNFFYNLLKGSQTQKMAGHISIPLLVFPAGS